MREGERKAKLPMLETGTELVLEMVLEMVVGDWPENYGHLDRRASESAAKVRISGGFRPDRPTGGANLAGLADLASTATLGRSAGILAARRRREKTLANRSRRA